MSERRYWWSHTDRLIGNPGVLECGLTPGDEVGPSSECVGCGGRDLAWEMGDQIGPWLSELEQLLLPSRSGVDKEVPEDGL